MRDEMIKLSAAIQDALFGNSLRVDIAAVGLDSRAGKKWLNQVCDVQGMWCNIHNGNEVFLTTDGNFTKETKLPELIALGAGRICHPASYEAQLVAAPDSRLRRSRVSPTLKAAIELADGHIFVWLSAQYPDIIG